MHTCLGGSLHRIAAIPVKLPHLQVGVCVNKHRASQEPINASLQARRSFPRRSRKRPGERPGNLLVILRDLTHQNASLDDSFIRISLILYLLFIHSSTSLDHDNHFFPSVRKRYEQLDLFRATWTLFLDEKRLSCQPLYRAGSRS
jgi:hypothetical protein